MSSTVSSRPPSWPAIAPAVREASKPSGVDDRHDDVARLRDDVRRARVAALVAVDQLERPLHRELAGRPLAGVVDAHVEERRLAVVAVDVLGDLDAEHVLAAVGLLGQREQLHEVRVLGREVLELGVVVGQRAVGRRGRSGSAEARRRRRGRRRAARSRGRRRPGRPGRSTSTRQRRPALRSAASSSAPCRTTPRLSVAAVLGHVEAERERAAASARASGVITSTSCGGSAFAASAAPGAIAECSSVAGTEARVAGAPARLHVDGAALQREAARDLLGVGRRVGGEHACRRRRTRATSQSPSVAVEAHLERAGAAQRHVARGDARGVRAGRRDGTRPRPRRRARSAARRARSWRRAAASARPARSRGRRGRSGRRG